MIYVDVPADHLRPALLRDALRGSATQVTPALALGLLANGDVDIPDRADVLYGAVVDPDVADPVRAAALRALANVDARRAVAAVRELDAPEERLASAAATTIGQVGESRDAAVLEALRRAHAGSDLVKRRADFAGVLLGHRFGLTEPLVDASSIDLLGAPGVASTAFASVPAGALRSFSVLASVHRELPWVLPSEQIVVELPCDGGVLGVAMRRDLLDGEVRRRLFETPAVAAVVTTGSSEHGTAAVGLLILTRSAGEGRLAIVVTRTTGDHVYAGTGTFAPDGTVMAELRAVRRPGSPTCVVRVLLSDAGLEIYGRASSSAVEPPLIPKRRAHADPPRLPREGG